MAGPTSVRHKDAAIAEVPLAAVGLILMGAEQRAPLTCDRRTKRLVRNGQPHRPAPTFP